MWLTDAQSEPIDIDFSSPIIQRSLAPEFGVALTSFGAFFMGAGVLMFFDRGLLALGNVSLDASKQRSKG